LDQTEGLNTGFTEKGYDVARYFLSLDKDGNYKPDDFGKRILIDVKHMNAISRQEFYNTFAVPSLNTDHPIPIIASHVAYSGRETLSDLIDGIENEQDGDLYQKSGSEWKFNSWNINLCDEDVINIYKSKGLIGINLDQRVLGVLDEDVEKTDTTHAKYVWQNVKSMMEVIIDSDDPELGLKNRVTDLFCLGTDFDGFIDPVNKYPTVSEFKLLREDLIEVIKNDKGAKKLLNSMDETKFVDKFCFYNAYDFVVDKFE